MQMSSSDQDDAMGRGSMLYYMMMIIHMFTECTTDGMFYVYILEGIG